MRHDDEQFEREFKSALSRYVTAEPRAGLEQRILANLGTARAREPRHSGMWLGGALVAAVAAMAIFIGARIDRNAIGASAHSPVQQIAAARGSRPAADGARVVGEAPIQEQVAQPPNHSARREKATNVVVLPKLAQFPAPAPLTEQERLLVRYVEEEPGDAALVAEAIDSEMQRELDEAKKLNSKQGSEQEP